VDENDSPAPSMAEDHLTVRNRRVVKAQGGLLLERMSQARCLCEAEKRMKVSSTPTLIGRGNEGSTYIKADPEQGNGPVL
jgi:hypothetical protein